VIYEYRMMNNILDIFKSKLMAGVFSAIMSFTFIAGSCHMAQAEEAGTIRNFKRGEKLPSIELRTAKERKKMSFVPGNGKPAVIMFFSIRPDFRKKRSLALLSSLSDLANQYKTKLDIIGIFSDNQMLDTVAKYIDASSINVTVYDDNQKSVYTQFGVFMMPLVILSDSNGKLHEVIPYTYNIQKIVDSNIKYLLGEWDKDQLADSLKPKETKIRSKEEKEYIRRINYGRIMQAKKMFGQAIREFSIAVKLMPHLIDAHIDLGFALLTSEKYDEAEKSFGEALKINEDSDEAISGLGLVYYKRGNIDAAFTELEKAFIAPNPRLEVIIALADIYEKKGLNDKANRLNKLAVSRLMTMYEQRWK